MQINIEIQRPFSLLFTLAAFGGILHWIATDPRIVMTHAQASLVSVQMSSSSVATEHMDEEPVGGDDSSASERSVKIEEEMMQTRALQALMGKQEELMRYQVDVLRQERQGMGDDVTPEVEEQFRQSVQELTQLLMDQKKAENFLLSAFNELFEAEGRTALHSYGVSNGNISLMWPIEPLLGISAGFNDSAYEERFGFKHYAIDIPAPQGTLVLAAAPGVVKEVVDNGLGFNYIVIQHEGGYATLYGHLTSFVVAPGDTVYAGQEIGYSGGRPGTPGAGFSTGQHLHFGLKVTGQATDPLPYLPRVNVGDYQ